MNTAYADLMYLYINVCMHACTNARDHMHVRITIYASTLGRSLA